MENNSAAFVVILLIKLNIWKSQTESWIIIDLLLLPVGRSKLNEPKKVTSLHTPTHHQTPTVVTSAEQNSKPLLGLKSTRKENTCYVNDCKECSSRLRRYSRLKINEEWKHTT